MNDRSESVTVKPCPTGPASTGTPSPVTIAVPRIAMGPTAPAIARNRPLRLPVSAGGPLSPDRSRSKTAALRAKRRAEYNLCLLMWFVPLLARALLPRSGSEAPHGILTFRQLGLETPDRAG